MQTGAELVPQQQQQKSGGGGGSSSSRPKGLDQQASNITGTKAGKDEEPEDDDDMAVGPDGVGGEGDDPEDSLGIGLG